MHQHFLYITYSVFAFSDFVDAELLSACAPRHLSADFILYSICFYEWLVVLKVMEGEIYIGKTPNHQYAKTATTSHSFNMQNDLLLLRNTCTFVVLIFIYNFIGHLQKLNSFRCMHWFIQCII